MAATRGKNQACYNSKKHEKKRILTFEWCKQQNTFSVSFVIELPLVPINFFMGAQSVHLIQHQMLNVQKIPIIQIFIITMLD